MKGIVPLIFVVLFQIFLTFLSIGSLYIMKETTFILGVPASMIIVILLNIVSLFIIGKIYQTETKQKVQLTETTHEEEFHSLVASVRSDRHDLNNHLTVISGLLKIGNYTDTENYVKELIGDIQVNNQVLKIHHPILASVLFTKMEKFKRDHIVFSQNIQSEKIMETISSTDFIRLMSNLLDNAYDATMELPVDQRKISLEMKELHGNFIIEVKNSSKLKNFDETLFQNEHSTKPREQSKSRGFGLSIIREITHKYNGDLQVKIDEELVCFKIVFTNDDV
ncbi:sensor histidine kinase [Robertmurraya korlensis]|uniref:sensor histidine kinase n=1 Tax=Robertmurraya korlensis TaxID=519977 RepID=UPI00082717F9|nr:GHKL domain-containing protein [Robertmurraya korlensis]